MRLFIQPINRCSAWILKFIQIVSNRKFCRLKQLCRRIELKLVDIADHSQTANLILLRFPNNPDAKPNTVLQRLRWYADNGTITYLNNTFLIREQFGGRNEVHPLLLLNQPL